jgi:hypothetical protein
MPDRHDDHEPEQVTDGSFDEYQPTRTTTDLSDFAEGETITVFFSRDTNAPTETLTGKVQTHYHGDKIALDTGRDSHFVIRGNDTQSFDNIRNSYTNITHGRFMFAHAGMIDPRPQTGVRPNPRANSGLSDRDETDQETETTDVRTDGGETYANAGRESELESPKPPRGGHDDQNLPDVMTNNTEEGRTIVFVGESVDARLSARQMDMADLEAWR